MDRNRLSLHEIHGIVFGTMGKPTHVVVPGYSEATPERFASWLDQLRADGWEVTLTPALSFEGVLVDGRRVSQR
jgi:hypothetical protein